MVFVQLPVGSTQTGVPVHNRVELDRKLEHDPVKLMPESVVQNAITV